VKLQIGILVLLVLIPVLVFGSEPGFNEKLKTPNTSFISPYPDEWDDPVISLDLNEEDPAFNYKLVYLPPSRVDTSSFAEKTLTFKFVYYRLGRDESFYYVPRTVDAVDYMEFRRRSTLRRDLSQVRAEALSKEQRDKQGGLVSINVPIKSKTFQSIFGEGGAGLNVSGYHRINMSGRSTWTDGAETATYKQNKFPSLNMEQVSRFDISGTIGSKITVSVSHDSKTDIPLANRIMLRYKGDDDDILKSVEAGNTTLSLPNTKFVGYSQSIKGLFGLKAEAQVGSLRMTAIASQEKGNSERTVIDAGASATKTTVRDYNYASGRIYDLGRKDPYVFEPSEMDFADGDSITHIEVYIYSGNNQNAGTGDPTAKLWVDPSDTTFRPEESQETTVKQVEPDQYIMSPTEHWVLFNSTNAGTQNEIGVYMIINRSSGVIDTVGNLLTEPYQLKLLKMKTPTSNQVTWNYMWRNVYYLQATNIDLDGLEINIFKGLVGTEGDESNLDEQDGIKYIKILGLDRYDLNGQRNPDDLVDINTPIVDKDRGLLIFPDRRPFFPNETYDAAGTILKDSIPEIYNSNNPQDILQKSQYYIEISNRSRMAEITLGKSNIIENSEKITLNGEVLQKGIDYNINYDFGQVTFLTDKATDPNADINIEFEYSPFITAQKKTLFGIRGEYEFSDDLQVGSTFLYKSDKATDRKPKVGQETAKATVWDADMSLKLRPNFLTDIFNVLPMYSSEASSNMQLSAEVAQSFPNPNVDGVAYIDDFEGSRDSYSLGVYRENWGMSSKPKGLDSTNVRGKLIWFNPFVQLATDDIWNRETRPGESGTHTLSLQFNPAESLLVVDTVEGSVIDTFITVDPLKSWAGVIRSMTAGSINQDKAELLELRMKVEYGAAIMHLEFGDISEDIDGDGIFDDEDKAVGERIKNNILDPGEDVGLDGLPDEQEPGYDPITNPDPNGDNWYYNGSGKGCNGCGPEDYSHLNGTEGNTDDPGRLGRPDSEDVNRDGGLDVLNNYFSFKIDLAAGDFLVDSSEYNGWNTYRIPIREEEFVDTTVGEPNWSLVNYVRIWFETADGQPFYLRIAAADLIQSNWEDSLVVRDSSAANRSIFNVAVINNQENINYVSPPGVEGYYDKTSEIREPEQSLLLKYTDLEPGDSCIAGRTLYDTPNYMGYRTLQMWVHGDSFVENDSLLFFFRIGTDAKNYYEYRTILQSGWDSANAVNMDFADVTILKELLTEAQAADPEINYAYSEDSVYKVHGNPSLTRIKYLASGIVNMSDTSDQYDANLRTGEVWINELRLSDVRSDQGSAARASVNGNISELFTYSVSYDYQDSYFRGVSSSTRGGSGDNLGSGKTQSSYSYTVNMKLDKLFPRSLGANIPISYRYSNRTEIPRLRFGTDIELPENLQQEEKTVNESKSFSVSESFNKNTKNPLFTVLLNKFKTNFSYNRSDGSSPKTPMSMSENYRLGGNYGLNFSQNKIPNIKPFFWTAPIPYLDNLSGSKFYFIPNSFSASGDLNRTLSISQNTTGVITQSLRRTFGGNMKVSYRISDPLTVNYSMNTQRDLNDPESVKLKLDPKKFKLGRETSYSQSLGGSYNPKIFSFLTHNFNYTAAYRENLNVSDTSLRADQSKAYGISGELNHKKFFGTDERRDPGSTGRSRGRNRGDAENVIVIEKKNFLKGLLSPFAKTLGFLTSWLDPINYDYNEKYIYSYSRLDGRASWMFRLGFTEELGAGFKTATGSGGIQQSSYSIARSTGYALRSGTKFFGGLKTDITFNRQVSRDLYKSTNPRKTVNTTFPDIKFSIQPLTTFKFLNSFIRKFSPRTSYTRSKSEVTDLPGGNLLSEKVTVSMRPFLSVNVNVLNGVNLNMTHDRSTSEDKLYNSQTNGLTSIKNSTQTSTSIGAKYSFTSPKGIKLPIFGRMKFKSTMTIQVDISIRKQKDRSGTPNPDFGADPSSVDSSANVTSEFLMATTGDRSDLVVSPVISYTFSQQIKGGITAKWQTSEDALLNRTTHTRELQFWVDIRF